MMMDSGDLCTWATWVGVWRGDLCTWATWVGVWRGNLCTWATWVRVWRGNVCTWATWVRVWRGNVCTWAMRAKINAELVKLVCSNGCAYFPNACAVCACVAATGRGYAGRRQQSNKAQLLYFLIRHIARKRVGKMIFMRSMIPP